MNVVGAVYEELRAKNLSELMKLPTPGFKKPNKSKAGKIKRNSCPHNRGKTAEYQRQREDF